MNEFTLLANHTGASLVAWVEDRPGAELPLICVAAQAPPEVALARAGVRLEPGQVARFRRPIGGRVFVAQAG